LAGAEPRPPSYIVARRSKQLTTQHGFDPTGPHPGARSETRQDRAAPDRPLEVVS